MSSFPPPELDVPVIESEYCETQVALVAPEGHSSPSLTIQDSTQQDSDSSILNVLPKSTKVLITGNNRTKSSLIGQYARTVKAVGLGGWHWLVLENSGEHVRLQRNALTVIEFPQESQNSDDSHQEHIDVSEQDTVQDKHGGKKRDRRPPKPLSPTDYTDVKRHSPMPHEDSPTSNLRVNLHKLETSTLKRYRRTYKLATVGPTSSREQLLQAVGHHFLTQTVDEMSVFAMFAQTARKQHLQAGQ